MYLLKLTTSISAAQRNESNKLPLQGNFSHFLGPHHTHFKWAPMCHTRQRTTTDTSTTRE